MAEGMVLYRRSKMARDLTIRKRDILALSVGEATEWNLIIRSMEYLLLRLQEAVTDNDYAKEHVILTELLRMLV